MSAEEAELPDREWEKMTSSLPRPDDSADAASLVWRQFCVQFSWYDRAAGRNRKAHLFLDLLALGAAAAVTVLAALGAPAPITASVGATIVVVEGVQKIGQFHANWINYRATAELMRQHGFSFAAGTTPYDDPRTRRDELVRFMHEAVTKESTTWAGTASKASRRHEE
ncbi:DUF4231 domain-containing protein [Kocuria sabuli]|uniref:DUF4231 domain-containing protein n=1 Tax=Kocuria sabuli TaxID=3071448 RepID=UPI0034D5220E